MCVESLGITDLKFLIQFVSERVQAPVVVGVKMHGAWLTSTKERERV